MRFPEKKYKDLSRSLFDFSLSFSVLFLFIFLVLAVIVNQFFSVKFNEAVQIIYRIALKEHNLQRKLNYLKYRYLLAFILLFYLLLNIVVEQVN